MPTAPDTVLPRSLDLSIGWDEEFQAPAIKARQSWSCPQDPIMRIDDGVAMPMKQGDYGHRLTGERARVAVEEFLAGKRVALQVHLAPDCESYVANIPLDGFPDAWAEYRAGMKAREPRGRRIRG